MKGVFVSDCEGPISKNDNAFEITAQFVPSGDKIFTLISRYDDVLAELVKKPGYKAGDTLKLILPFLKAYGVTDLLIRELSARKLALMPLVKITLDYITKIAPAYVISTSYEHYIEALCKAIGFPFENTYCTKLRLDRYELGWQERDQLRRIASEITVMPTFEIPLRSYQSERPSCEGTSNGSKVRRDFLGHNRENANWKNLFRSESDRRN